MNKRLFFLKQDGWFEAEVTAKLLNSSDGELFRWAYAMMDKYGYRNYWITENPGIIIGGRASLRATQSKCSVSEDTCSHRQIASSAKHSLQNRIIRHASSQ